VTAQEWERELCAIYADLLGIPDITPQDSFFDLGGHSLLASRLVRRIHSEFGASVPIRRIYDVPTPEALAKHLSAA
jgi:acyl carrier protein